MNAVLDRSGTLRTAQPVGPIPFALWRREARAMLSLGLPLALTQLAQIAMTTTDVVMLGHVSPRELAAGSLGYAVFVLFQLLTLGIVLGTAPMMAQAVGRGQKMVRDIRRTVRQGFWAAVLLGVPCVAVMWGIKPVLILAGQDPTIAADASAYIRAVSLGLVPFLWFIVLRAFVATLNRPRSALIITGIGVVANGLFNYALIYGHWGAPRLGVVGAGIGSSAATVLMFVLMQGYVSLDRRFARFSLLGRFWRADWHRLGEVMRLGVPIGLTMLCEMVLFAGSAFLMGILGADRLAAHQIAIQIASVTFMVPLGIGQAASIRAGIAAGAGDLRGIRLAGWTALALGVGFMAAMAILLYTIPRTIGSLFLSDPHTVANRHVLDLAVVFLGYAALFQMFDAAQVVGASVLRGLKDTRVPMMFALVGYWGVGLVCAGVFAFWFGWDGAGIWIAFVLALAVAATLMVGRFALRDRFAGLRRTIEAASGAVS